MIADALKTKTMELRKARDPMSTFLVAVNSKAADLAKAESPLDPKVTDEHALRAINSFIKIAVENIEMLSAHQESPTYLRAVAERALLKDFLPQEVSAADVEAEVRFFMQGMPDVDRKKLMGPIIQHLSKKFGAALNKKEASAITLSVLNAG